MWREGAAPFAAVETDPLGNSFARVGPGDGPPVLLLGHIDEIGLAVSGVEHDDARFEGLARVRSLGSWDPQVLIGQAVEVRLADGTQISGVLGQFPVHLYRSGKPPRASVEALWLDVGDRDAWERLSIGDSVVPEPRIARLGAHRLASKALDNRAGAYIVLEAARRAAAEGLSVPVVACAAVLEETLGDGARAAAHAVSPTVSIVVDVTHAGDVPGGGAGTMGTVRLGGGPVLTRGLGLHPRLHRRLQSLADELRIDTCAELVDGGNSTYTDVDGALDALAGSAAALVSLPLRHMHSPSEVCDLRDVESIVRLLAAFLVSLRPDEDWRR